MAWADTSEQHGHVDVLRYRLVRLQRAADLLGKPGRSSGAGSWPGDSAE
jgi:hypothetical protein